MKTPRITDFDPNAKPVPGLSSSMDHFPTIEKPQQRETEHSPLNTDHPLPQSPSQQSVAEAKKVEKPEIMKSRNHESHSPTQSVIEKPEKYSTLLRPHFKKKIKMYAAERDIKDHEVLELILTEFFKKHQ